MLDRLYPQAVGWCDAGDREGGWLIAGICLGGTPISDGSSLVLFKSLSEVHPVAIWSLWRAGRAWVGSCRTVAAALVVGVVVSLANTPIT